MKTMGLIGGLSWESTAVYYRIINEEVRARLGGLHSARIMLYSVDFHEIEQCQSSNQWEKAARILNSAARSLESGGADFFIICANTMHKVADQARAGVKIPFLHLADLTAAEILGQKIKRVGLLGTRYTMEEDFYTSRLSGAGLEVLVPRPGDRRIVNSIIFEELCLGRVLDQSRAEFIRIIDQLQSRGAEAVILGCTEITLLVKKEDARLPLFDTTRIHAVKAVAYALT
jgi:aspartate racemase